MSDGEEVVDIQGHEWSFTYDTRQAPDYVLVTIRGRATLERTECVMEMIGSQRPETRLATGHICPIIIDLHDDSPPTAAVLRATYEYTDQLLPRISYVVFVLPPHHEERTRMHMSLEALGLSVAPNLVVVPSVTQAVEKVRAYHRWRASH